jgi:hypothetical protein
VGEDDGRAGSAGVFVEDALAVNVCVGHGREQRGGRGVNQGP